MPRLRCAGNRNGTCGTEGRLLYHPPKRAVRSWALLADAPPPEAGAPANEALATAERLRDQAAAIADRLIAAIEQAAVLDPRLSLRQAELAQAEEAVATARCVARAAVPTSSPEERSGILAALRTASDLPDTERYAARATAAQELRDLITQVFFCHADCSVTVWAGDRGFRIHVEDDEARILGGVETVPGEVKALLWESREGAVAEPFLPMR